MHYSLINLRLTHSPETRGKHSLFLVPCVQGQSREGWSHMHHFQQQWAVRSLLRCADLETWPHTFTTALPFMLYLLPRTSLTLFSLPSAYPANFLPSTFCSALASYHRYLCLLLRPPPPPVWGTGPTPTKWSAHTDWTEKFCRKDLLPMNYFPPKSNPSLIHIFKWSWDSHYLKLVLLKCNSVVLNAFTMLGKHVELVLEHFRDSESNPECIKQYSGSYFPPHSSWKTLICFLFVSVDLPTLDSSYQWNHTIRDLFCMVSST